MASFRPTLVVLAERFDGSMEMVERYQLRFISAEGVEYWLGPGMTRVRVGDWMVTKPDSFVPPQAIPEGEFAATYELAGQDKEDARDLALRVAGDRIRELEHDLAQMTDQARRAREVAAAAGSAAPVTPPKSEPGEWYSCAICAHKTNEPSVMQEVHACCHGMARVGPCCERATRNSTHHVCAVLRDTNHVRGCSAQRG